MSGKWKGLFPNAARADAQFYINGEAYFAAISDAIDGTGQGDFICIAGWMIDVDLPLKRSAALLDSLSMKLAMASGRGVEVSILIWDNWLTSYSKLLRTAEQRFADNPAIRIFRVENPNFPASSRRTAIAAQRKVLPLLTKYAKFLAAAKDAVVGGMSIADMITRGIGLLSGGSLAAHHEKVVIVGRGERLDAWCGGIDFNRNRIDDGSKKGKISWTPGQFDVAVRVDGCIAYDILQRFVRRWQAHPPAARLPLRAASAGSQAGAASGPWAWPVSTWNSPDGRIRDRGYREAYLRIIANAREHIFMTDQYFVDLEIAEALRKKLSEPQFKSLILITQDKEATSDIMIPNSRRGAFALKLMNDDEDLLYKFVFEKYVPEKFLMLVPDRKRHKKGKFPLGVHSKVMIADDEVAIVGSANINRRGMTLDSETGVVLFSDQGGQGAIARQIRTAIWEFWMIRAATGVIANQDALNLSIRNPYFWGNASFLKIDDDWIGDGDAAAKLYDYAEDVMELGPVGVRLMNAAGLTADDIILLSNRRSVFNLFEEIFDNFIDPDGG